MTRQVLSRSLIALPRTIGRVDHRKRPSITSTKWASATARQWSTPLAKTIAEVIQTTGPISIAAYMRQCLTSPDGGYYTTQTEGRDQFGQKGDFVTSPEISQVFGELLGIWMVAEWINQGRQSSGIQVIEVGPGRGTLMDDILRTICNFKPLAASIESVYLVESSPALREKQKQLLCGEATLEETGTGFCSRSKHANIPVIWCEDLRFVPKDPSKAPYIFAHEFFDALPIHAFQSVPPSAVASSTHTGFDGSPRKVSNPQSSTSQTPQWRELVVTAAPSPPISTKTITATSETSAPDFQLSLAKASTPSSLLLPEISARYRALKSTPGAVIEISPEGQSCAAEFAQRIGGSPLSKPAPPRRSTTASLHRKSALNHVPTPSPTIKSQPSGAALIFDYGPLDTIPTSTLRGIRAHKLCSPFSTPGLVDISTDVDFMALAEAAINASPGVEVHGPVEQGAWLEVMGIRERADMLIKQGLEEDGDLEEEKLKRRVRGAVERLVERGGGGMGRLYKVLAIVPERGGTKPVGFGGDV